MTRNIDRRLFLQSSAAVPAATLLGQALPTTQPKATTPAPNAPPPTAPAPPPVAPRPTLQRAAWINFQYLISWPSMNLLQQTVAGLIDRGVKEITLEMSSDGGSLAAAIATYNFLMSAGIELTTYNVGNVYSAAVLIFLAGERRVSETSAQFIIHPPGMTTTAQTLTADDLALRNQSLGLDTTRMRDIIVGRAHYPRERVEEMLRKTTFIDPATATQNGLATEVGHLKRPGSALLISLIEPRPALPPRPAP